MSCAGAILEVGHDSGFTPAKPRFGTDRQQRQCLRNVIDRVERMQNLRKAFAMRKNTKVRGKHLLLLDDVMTTGSTLHECALVLREAGAASVRAITVARG